MSAPLWIDLEGAANVRDVGGLPTADGRTTRSGRLIRSDSLQTLTDKDVRRLVDDVGVRAVADLRTGAEVRSEGPGPLLREPLVHVEHLSLFVEDPPNDDADPGAPVVLPWQSREAARSEEDRRRGAAGVYLNYLEDRADSVIAALRLIAESDGATIVHCAAGKDRTGMIVALALTEVGVTRDAIIADYVRSGERIEAVLDRLAARRTYAADLDREPVDKHRPRAQTMERVLDAMDGLHGGVAAWLRAHGWTDADAAALRRKLLG